MRLPQHLVPYLSTTPQPIALSLGRVARGSSRPERLEACLKAAEMLTRYLAVISLASAAATKPLDQDLPVVEGFEGNRAFGTFELAIRQAIAVSWEHPLREQLRAAMRSTKKHQAVTGVQLKRFVQLRNELGHAITHVDELRAGSIFEQFDPIGALIECIEDLGPVLRCRRSRLFVRSTVDTASPRKSCSSSARETQFRTTSTSGRRCSTGNAPICAPLRACCR